MRLWRHLAIGLAAVVLASPLTAWAQGDCGGGG